MGLIRVLILAGVGYLLYRQFFGRVSSGIQGETRVPEPPGDVLVEDPVCHTYIPRQGAESCTVAGTTHYFCSPECRKKFQSEPRSTS